MEPYSIEIPADRYEKTKPCPSCKAEVKTNAKFCPKCGIEIDPLIQNPSTYKIQRIPLLAISKEGLSNVEYTLTDESGVTLMTAKDQRYSLWALSLLCFLLLMCLSFFSLVTISENSPILEPIISQNSPVLTPLLFFGIILGILFLILLINLDFSACTIYSSNGSMLGEILPLKRIKERGNYSKGGYMEGLLVQTGYKILDVSNENQTTLQFIRSADMVRRAEISTRNAGSYTAITHVKFVKTKGWSIGYYRTTEFTITDSQNNPSFQLIWVDHKQNPKSGKDYLITSNRKMDPFLLFSLSIRLITYTLVKYVHFDHTPD
ncbi:MAG: zinc ribbon domain-containing protein [Candidatus Hodarchaeales archaeon]|jgi:hypothetical protein